MTRIKKNSNTNIDGTTAVRYWCLAERNNSGQTVTNLNIDANLYTANEIYHFETDLSSLCIILCVVSVK
jgi:hypothetical protein